ncbi:MAG: hypothetical protein M1318_06250 [Firmicutes bacterium]|nr:hypothetical protein [Bacillota bacterium]
MTVLLSNATSALILILPWPLFMVGLVVGVGGERYPHLMKKMTVGAAGFALACAVVAAGTYLGGLTASPSYVIVRNLPEGLGTLAIGADVNSLTILMSILVGLVGLVVTRYAYTYLNGDTHEERFHQ